MTAILRAESLYKSFGAVTAADNINVSIDEGEVIGVIGANGAGKTTFVNMVTGYLAPTSGKLFFYDRDITGFDPKHATEIGICRSFQIPQLFSTGTTFENLMIAMGIAEEGTMPFWQPLDTEDRKRRCEEILANYEILEYRDQVTQTLSQGVRKLLDIAMASVHKPKMLMLDEPTSGVTAAEKFSIMDIVVTALKQQDVTILFVEHDMEIISRYATRVLAFYDGRIIADAKPEEALADEQVRQFVIGETVHVAAAG
ncbi:ABC transporter ATP-binding protein [Hwanghaeella sp.]|uniref:ABC transporter ATP-binding protein n=1 Tax=Hwanghaeella sp. TaxID=2605943 RepID=UPI003CCC33D3